MQFFFLSYIYFPSLPLSSLLCLFLSQQSMWYCGLPVSIDKSHRAFFFQVVQEEIPIPSSFVRLSYLSSRTPGYKTLLRILLTHSTIPVGMVKVHLTVAVEGRLTQKWFPAAVNLVYTFAWNKTDIYGQKVWGLTEALGMLKSM